MNIVINISAEGTPAEVAKSLQLAASRIANLDGNLSSKGETITAAGFACTAYKVIG